MKDKSPIELFLDHAVTELPVEDTGESRSVTELMLLAAVEGVKAENLPEPKPIPIHESVTLRRIEDDDEAYVEALRQTHEEYFGPENTTGFLPGSED